MSNKLNLRVLHDMDLNLLRDACKKRKGHAEKFYGWLEDDLRREHTRRLLIDSDRLPGAPVALRLPTFVGVDAREAVGESSRIGQFFLRMAKEHPEDEKFIPTSNFFAQIVLQLLARFQEAQARN